MLATWPYLKNTDFPKLKRNQLETLQVNLGYLCNQQCLHCHVNAGPKRTEIMSAMTIGQICDYLQYSDIKVLDLTGGAPELNPNFCSLVSFAHKQGIQVLDRCNLSVLFEPGQENLAEFMADNQVEVIASMPCYLEENVDQQRGDGTFNKSIKALQKLNKLGFGQENSGLILNLVYNPGGPTLPPSQQLLEQDYKKTLWDGYGVVFSQLYSLCNMPIKRFGSSLLSKGTFNDYMELLKNSHNQNNLENLMCLNLISIDWQGYLYDCDFNQMLELPLAIDNKARLHISELAKFKLQGNKIQVANHCYACTAGSGSSCGGALS